MGRIISAKDRRPLLSVWVRRIHRNLEDYGWSTTLRKTLQKAMWPIFFRNVYRLYRIELSSAPREETSASESSSFRLLPPEAQPEIEQIETNCEWLRGRLKKRLAGGDLCLIAEHGNDVAGFNLISTGEIHLAPVNWRRRFRSPHAWSEQIVVMKKFRNLGLASELRYRIFEELRARGFRRLYGGTSPSNLASLALARKVGFREIVDLTYVKILGFKFWTYRKVRR